MENVTADLKAREAIARTGFSAIDVTKLQGIQISCQKSVRAMIGKESQHHNSGNEKRDGRLKGSGSDCPHRIFGD